MEEGVKAVFDLSQLPEVLTDRCSFFRLEIHSRDHAEYQGRVVHMLGGVALPFRSMMECLWAVERLIDGMGYVQKAVKPRTWQEAPVTNSSSSARFSKSNMTDSFVFTNTYVDGWDTQTEQEALLSMKQSSVSFVIKIQYRQHATWQGTLEWLDGHRTQHFRSTMEMLKLMEEVVEASNVPDDSDIVVQTIIHS